MLFDDFTRAFCIELARSTQKIVCWEPLQREECVGHCRLRPTKIIASWARVCTHAFRSQPQMSRRLINIYDAAAAKSDRLHHHGRSVNGNAKDISIIGHNNSPFSNDANLRGCATNIQGDDLRHLVSACKVRSSKKPHHWSRLKRIKRFCF